jgi:hypothetical protein
MRLRFVASCLLCLALTVHAAEPSATLADHPTIRLILDGKPSDVLDRASLAQMPRTTVKAAAPGEQPSTWQGVALKDIVSRTCVASGDAMTGRALARLVRVTTANGDQVVFGAAELHPDFGNAEVILADSKDGQPLAQNAPFRLIVPKDKRPDRWLTYVTTVEVLDASTP